MELKVISSGSKGNTVAVISGESVLLVDLGLPKTKADKMLLENGIAMKDVCGVLVSHSHGDHICGIPLAEKYSVPIFASEGTFKVLKCENQNVIAKDLTYNIDKFQVIAFDTYHNDYQSFGYVISDGEQQASVLLDTGKVTSEMIGYMMGSDIILIESNHDRDMVVLSDYPLSVQERNLSDLGHLSNEQAAEALAKIITGNGEKILLAHLSSKCNTPDLAKYAVKQELKKKGFTQGRHYTLEVH